MKLSRVITIALLFTLAVLVACELAASVSSQLSDAEGPGDSGLTMPPEATPVVQCVVDTAPAETLVPAESPAVQCVVQTAPAVTVQTAEPVANANAVDVSVNAEPAPQASPVDVAIAVTTPPAATETPVAECPVVPDNGAGTNTVQRSEVVTTDGSPAIAYCVNSPGAGNVVSTSISSEGPVTISPAPGFTVSTENGLVIDAGGVDITINIP